MSTSPVAQKCKPHQPQSLWSSVITESHLKCVLRSIKTENGEALKFSPALDVCSHGPGVSREQSYRPVLSLCNFTPLNCSVQLIAYNTANPTGSVTTGPQNLLPAPFPSQLAQQRYPATSCSLHSHGHNRHTHLHSHPNAEVQRKNQHPMLVCHATPRYRSGEFTWPFRTSP